MTNKLFLGDSLKIMEDIEDESVDMIATDPPYGMSYQGNYSNSINVFRKIENDDNLDWLEPFVKESYRIAKPNTAHYMFCSWHKVDVFKQVLQKYFTVKNLLVWLKKGHSAGDLEGDFTPQFELIFFFTKGRRIMRGRRDGNLLPFNKILKGRSHPTEKPVALMQYLISKFTEKGETVFDGFMGVGSTGVAAQQIERDFIGVEIDEEYFTIANQRINKANQLALSPEFLEERATDNESMKWFEAEQRRIVL
tara:strand:+ start:4162 stop:4914 length:753 start_codon:yes stop_codon:yes gene_type:complete